jgi:hypothetical protein
VFVLSRVAASAQEEVVLPSSKWEAIRLPSSKRAGKIDVFQKNPAALQSKAPRPLVTTVTVKKDKHLTIL